MSHDDDVMVVPAPDGGILILQRPADLDRKKREAVERLRTELDQEVDRLKKRFRECHASGMDAGS